MTIKQLNASVVIYKNDCGPIRRLDLLLFRVSRKNRHYDRMSISRKDLGDYTSILDRGGSTSNRWVFVQPNGGGPRFCFYQLFPGGEMLVCQTPSYVMCRNQQIHYEVRDKIDHYKKNNGIKNRDYSKGYKWMYDGFAFLEINPYTQLSEIVFSYSDTSVYGYVSPCGNFICLHSNFIRFRGGDYLLEFVPFQDTKSKN